MKYCTIKNCNNSIHKEKKTGKHVALFGFPKKSEEREKWIKAIKTYQQDLVLKTNSTVCQEHFNETNLYKIGLSSLRLYEGSVPSIFPNTSNLSIIETTSNYEENNTSSEILMEDDSTYFNQEQNIKYLSNTNPLSHKSCLMRYPGDITSKKVENMSLSNLKKSIIMLKRKYIAQQIIMKRLRSQVYSQKKQIKSLKQLLIIQRQNNYISSMRSTQVLEVS